MTKRERFLREPIPANLIKKARALPSVQAFVERQTERCRPSTKIGTSITKKVPREVDHRDVDVRGLKLLFVRVVLVKPGRTEVTLDVSSEPRLQDVAALTLTCDAVGVRLVVLYESCRALPVRWKNTGETLPVHYPVHLCGLPLKAVIWSKTATEVTFSFLRKR